MRVHPHDTRFLDTLRTQTPITPHTYSQTRVIQGSRSKHISIICFMLSNSETTPNDMTLSIQHPPSSLFSSRPQHITFSGHPHLRVIVVVVAARSSELFPSYNVHFVSIFSFKEVTSNCFTTVSLPKPASVPGTNQCITSVSSLTRTTQSRPEYCEDPRVDIRKRIFSSCYFNFSRRFSTTLRKQLQCSCECRNDQVKDAIARASPHIKSNQTLRRRLLLLSTLLFTCSILFWPVSNGIICF
ncbi:hypothetical protein QCA50_012530 [Cerrena zonata]|uniref:Transmembrane protein n=1 Tax=Cerrena zonata TaxID=2478898 RepID=A0AAW0FTP8_9APHY